MSRDWLAVYPQILHKPKYRRLGIPDRAALFHVWLLAAGQIPEATWPSREDLAEMLELDGFVPESVDELIRRRWLDVDPSGRVLVHDWDDHQLAASDAIRRAYERDRKQEWRRRRIAGDPLPPAPPSTEQEQDRTVQSPGMSRNVRDMSGTRPADPASPLDPTTCPRCGDLLDPACDDLAVVNRRGETGHRVCPTIAVDRAVLATVAGPMR